MDELENFKTNINPTEYAAGQGYDPDRRMSSRNSVIMRQGNGAPVRVQHVVNRRLFHSNRQ